MGDYNQIPAIGENIIKWIFKVLIQQSEIKSPNDDLMVEAVNIFKTFKRMKLTVQQRAQSDPEHTERIRAMSDYSITNPVNQEFINYLKTKKLTIEDTSDPNSPWVTESVCLTTSNIERATINDYRSKLFAIVKSEICVIWPLNTPGGQSASLSTSDLNEIRNRYPETNGYFVRGAPAVLTENLNPEKGLSNGTIVIMNSLVFDKSDEELYEETMNLLNSAVPGSTVYISQAPSHIIIEYKPKHVIKIIPAEQLPSDVASPMTENYICVAIGNVNDKPRKSSIIVGEKIFPNYSVYDAAVEPLFAVTYDKSQGKTLQYVILCLHKNSGFSASLAKMFVGFTRVTNSIFLRVWPALDEDLNLERFLKEKHDLALVLFDQAYDINGNFQDSLYMAAYQRYLDAQIVRGHIRLRAETSGLDSGESGPIRSLQRQMSVEGILHPQTTNVVLDQPGAGLGQRQQGRGTGRGRGRGRGRGGFLPLPNVLPQSRPAFVVRGLSQSLNPPNTGEVTRQGNNTTLQSASSIQHGPVTTRNSSVIGQIRLRAETSGLDSGESGPIRSLPRQMSVEGILHPQTTSVVLDQIGTELGQGQGGRGIGRGRGRRRGRG